MIDSLAAQKRRMTEVGSIVVNERVYLDAHGKATTDPESGVRLWATPGTEVLATEAEAVGYSVPVEKPKAVKRPGGTKVVEGPGGDK